MHVTTDMSAEDFVSGLVQHVRAQPKPAPRKQAGHIGIIILLIAGALGSVAATASGTYPHFDLVIRIGLMCAAVCMVTTVIELVRVYFAMRKQADGIEQTANTIRSQIRNGLLLLELGEHRVSISAEGINDVGPQWRLFRSWKMISGIEDLPDYIGICRGSAVFGIPKRAFDSPQAAIDFYEYAKRLHTDGGPTPPVAS